MYTPVYLAQVRLATSHYITPSHKNMQPHTIPYMLPHTTSIPLPHNLRAGRMPGKFTATYTQWGARVEILHIHTHAHAPKSGAGDGSGASQSEAWGRGNQQPATSNQQSTFNNQQSTISQPVSQPASQCSMLNDQQPINGNDQ